jgi:hypothetical protein
MTMDEIWRYAQERGYGILAGSKGKTLRQTMEARIDVDIRDNLNKRNYQQEHCKIITLYKKKGVISFSLEITPFTLFALFFHTLSPLRRNNAF